MFDWISNIRIGTKLGFGFGLVLALTSLLALTGWIAINSLDERGLKIESIARVAEMTKDLRVHRLQIELNRKGDGAQLILQTLEKLTVHLNTARTHLTSPSDFCAD
jgi:methyl-accepting chemotaxis protein